MLLRPADCIRQVASTLAANLKRPADLVARYGGEEFAVLLPETGVANAELVAETLRQAVADLTLPHQGSGHGRVTISIGVASGRCDARTSTASILAAADGALYVAKDQGRNRVCVAAESPSLTLVRKPAG
jgi:diguanylate cyclase (GGDEF)-like protein